MCVCVCVLMCTCVCVCDCLLVCMRKFECGLQGMDESRHRDAKREQRKKKLELRKQKKVREK